ncbi:VOC family protein [Chitinophaga barathri]|uniref:Glyoxalase/bleomycin resistance/extradiol dioxygenase family protein n=1 Tax=Chitinophaga barathri TaxID=1647451 RepID=A0A3N4MDM8_9BACT|nr:VOC family protein [Chitinophaga barathri]RPD40066.1 glyoxalase/bleomycin resistance/extradiol dioxygenase family protein [Chitinophaga barathri]
MATKVFINLPVKDLNRSKAFFEGLGYSFNPQFTDENAACMVISDTIYVMLLIEPYFQTFTKKGISDATKQTEVLIALDASSKEEVVNTIAKAKELGATIYNEPQDHGWMYQHSFADLDGHQWELAYMDETQMPG